MDGTPFGRYRLVGLLGRGGMGEVWRAFDTATHRLVAVKVLTAEVANDPMFEQRFRREAFAAAGLNDPHVVPIHNFGEIDGRLYVDMRLIDGCDLEALLRSGGPIKPVRAADIVDQVASALGAAHKVGLVHRDVKPSNVLLTEDDFAYLIDFGISRTAKESRLTSVGDVIGTWPYMAPERITAGEADPRSDVYALTCVLHQCVTGQLPFPVRGLENQIAAHLGSPPPRPSTLRNGVPQQLDEVIARGMAKDPEQRYATPKELATAARAATTAPIPRPPVARPLIVPRPPIAKPPQPAPIRHRPAAAPAVLPAGPAKRPPQTPRPFAAMPTPAPHPRRKRRGKAFIIATVAVIVAIAAAVTVVTMTRHRQPSAPVAEAELDGLLLDAATVSTAMATSGMAVKSTLKNNVMWTYRETADTNCLAISQPAHDAVYTGTGWSAVRGQVLKNPGSKLTALVDENVVAFPSASDAASFYAASSRNWAACSNHRFTDTPSGGKSSDWSVGPKSDQDGFLTVSATEDSNPTWTAQRALTVKNNVVIDVLAQARSPSSQLAAAIAKQIAAKVPG